MSKRKFKEKKSKKEKEQKDSVHKEVLRLLNDNPGRAYDFKQIARKIGAKNIASNSAIFTALEKLESDGKIKQLANGSFTSVYEAEGLTGAVDHVNRIFVNVVTGIEGQKGIYNNARHIGVDMHGDKVLVELFGKRTGENPEGKVIEVIQRGRNRIVGKVELSKNYAFIVPDFKKLYQDFFVYPENINGATNNDKVLFEVTRWPEGDKSPEGKIIEILGKTGENEAEIHSIVAEFDLPFRIPDGVLSESEHISEEIQKDEIKKRWDFRETLTFTIDPEDAKDFDDAISLRKLDNGNYEIGVHIADVTHYVKSGTILDDDAFDRATSVYLVDRTVPMLPEKLSNGLCSLRPNEDKLTFAAIFEMDDKAKVISEKFGRTIIHSDQRFTYENAQEGIETGAGNFAKELKLLNDLAIMLRKKRFANGAVNFETTEVKFKLDEKGKPLEVVPKIRKDAHKLVEEFMLLANKAVATFVYKMKKSEGKNTFVYRTHDFPDPERVRDFSLFARQFGHKINVDEKTISSSLNKLMEEIEGKPEQNVLQSLAVRSMAKAKYTTDEKGHSELAFVNN